MNKIDPTSVFDRPIAFNRGFVNLGCGITGALLLSQAVYWSKRTSKGDGWFYKTATEWEEETGLSRREQETARAKLRDCGVLLELKQGLPCKTYFCIDFTILFQLCGFSHTGMHESANQVATNTPNRYGGMSESSTETTTEITTDIKEVISEPSVNQLRSHLVDVFEFWKNTMEKTGATKLDSKRKSKIEQRLRDGYTVDQIKQAIINCSKTPHNMGQNDRGQKYNDIELICRDAANLERFMESNPDQAAGQVHSIQQDDTSWGSNIQHAYIPNQQKVLGNE